MSTSRTGLLGEAGEWLLLFTVAGQTFRFATAPVEVVDGSHTHRFAEGLSELRQALASDGSSTSSIRVEVVAGESWDEIVANFASIERSRCELRRFFDGQQLSQTRLVLAGFVRGFAYGEEDQPISFSIVRDVRIYSRMLPTAGMLADRTTWPVRLTGGWTIDESIIGSSYPLVIGFPGAFGATGEECVYEGLLVEVGGTPARLSRVLIAGHRVQATVIHLCDFTDDINPAFDDRPVLETTDRVGRTISYVEVGTGLPSPDPRRVYYVGHTLATGGGLLNPRTGGVLRGAGDVLEWLLEVWTDIKVDSARFAAVKPRLNRYKIDTYVSEPTSPLDLIDKFLGFLPVTPRTGEDGLYYYLRPLDATSIDAVAHLSADAGQVDRATLIQSASDQIVNEVTVEFAPIELTGRYLGRITISADNGVRVDELDPRLTTDSRILGNYRAKLSQGLYGRQPITISLDDVFDEATAVLVAQDIIAEQALPRRFVDYRGGTELEAFDPGNLITMTDSTVRLDLEVALVLDLTVGGADVLLHLELLDDPTTLRRFVTS